MKKKGMVYVGLSGGVDSSVAAALLHKEGYTVIGVFIKVWQPDFLPCTWKEERLSAMRVAAHLGISFQTMDLSEAYKQEIVDYMLEGYTQGETPNPDLLCNEKIKFGAFATQAFRDGADFVATGHYARVKKDEGGVAHLLRAEDSEKDQTYFLSRVSQTVLQKTLFPIGGLQKSEVRAHARRFGLSTFDKKDSQGICFLGQLTMKDFLKEFLPVEPGVVLNERGEPIGEHDGVAFYTEGERHGFRVFAKEHNAEPLFVTHKDRAQNTLTVSPHHVMRKISDITLRDIRETVPGCLKAGETYSVLIRYRHQPIMATITTRTEQGATVRLENAESAVPCGQAVVFYRGEECLGSGIVATVA